MRNQQGVFQMWLKNFLCLVFTQAFQAIFLAITMVVMAKIISDVSAVSIKKDGFAGFVDNVSGDSRKYFICSIIAYAGVTGIIKLDKLVRAIFQIEDSPLFGDLSKQMRKFMLTMSGLSRTKDSLMASKSNIDSAKKRVSAASTNTKRITGNLAAIDSMAGGKTFNTTNNNGESNTNITMSGAGIGKEQIAALFNNDGNFNSKGVLDEGMSTSKQMLYDAEAEEYAAKRNLSDSRRKMAVKALATVAGFGLANGAFDDAEEVAQVGEKLSGIANSAGEFSTRGIQKRHDRMLGAQALRDVDNTRNAELKKAASKSNGQVTKEIQDTIDKNAEVMRQAIADQSRDIAKEFKIPTPKQLSNTAKKEIKKAADDWLGTDLQADKGSRISRSDAKASVIRNAKTHESDRRK